MILIGLKKKKEHILHVKQCIFSSIQYRYKVLFSIKAEFKILTVEAVAIRYHTCDQGKGCTTKI